MFMTKRDYNSTKNNNFYIISSLQNILFSFRYIFKCKSDIIQRLHILDSSVYLTARFRTDLIKFLLLLSFNTTFDPHIHPLTHLTHLLHPQLSPTHSIQTHLKIFLSNL